MLKKGDKVPNVALVADDGRKVSLSEIGKGRAVVYFYPKNDTPGCTREAQAFTASKAQFDALGVPVFAISKDSLESHCKFRDKYKLRIPLLSDPSLAAHEAFGAYGEKTLYGRKFQGVIRSTFVLEGGKIAHVFPSVKVDGHAEKVLEVLGGSAPTAKKKAATPAKKTAPPTKKAATPAKKTAAARTSKK